MAVPPPRFHGSNHRDLYTEGTSVHTVTRRLPVIGRLKVIVESTRSRPTGRGPRKKPLLHPGRMVQLSPGQGLVGK